ncbi:MAG TPA: hypothetical protein VIF44_07725 [Candidatus Limnocylindrales bacterium]|jgi:hypothetical protein
MTGRPNSLLGEIASQAAIERSTFLVDAARQLDGFLKTHASAIAEVGGLVLIDEEPDYLAVAPDGSFRSRTRYQDEATGEWHAETEVIESVAELVELYNPAEVFAAFAEAAREAAGLPAEPTGAEDLMVAAGIAPDASAGDPYADAAADWVAGAGRAVPDDAEEAAARLYDLALTFQERSQSTEAGLLADFEVAAEGLAGLVGGLSIVDDDDERLTLQADGHFHGEVVPEEDPDRWRQLDEPEDIVQFYDPTDVFGDLAESIAEAYPSVAPELSDEGEAVGKDDGSSPA